MTLRISAILRKLSWLACAGFVALSGSLLFPGFVAERLKALQPTAQGRVEKAHGSELLVPDLGPALTYSRQRQGAAVLIMRSGKVVLEEYQNGRRATEPGYIASGTKSFWGPVVAAMIEDRLVSSFEERISETITEWKNDRYKSQITVRHLLQMTSGLGEDMRAIGGESGAARDKYALAVALPTVGRPGVSFRYGPAHYYALGEFLERKLVPMRLTPLQYLTRRILDPIGAKYGKWEHDPSGNPHLPNGAYLTARDWATYGRFLAQYGQWEGKQIVRRDLMQACFQPSGANPGMGLGIWLNQPGGFGVIDAQRASPGAPAGFIFPWGHRDMVGAMGAGKNRMYVIPSQSLVVVRQAIGRKDKYVDSEFLALVLAGAQATDFTDQEQPMRESVPVRAHTSRRLSRALNALDKNGDGVITLAEIPEDRTVLRKSFERLDKDGNGSLSPEELAVMTRRRD